MNGATHDEDPDHRRHRSGPGLLQRADIRQELSAAEVEQLVAHGFQPGAWVVDGFTAADTGSSVQRAVESNAKKCWYVLDVQLCD